MMTRYSAPADLNALLLRRCEKVQKTRHTVLFKRGEVSFGMFLVLRGRVSLDFGVDGSSPLNKAYGPGALIGLPATLTGRPYSMTATVTDDAELGLVSCETLKALLREQPQACQELLTMLTAKIVQTDEITRAVLGRNSTLGPELGLA
jgi:CRP-like cAMP-binding protein